MGHASSPVAPLELTPTCEPCRRPDKSISGIGAEYFPCVSVYVTAPEKKRDPITPTKIPPANVRLVTVVQEYCLVAALAAMSELG